MKQKLSIILILGLVIFIIVKNNNFRKTYLEESDTVGVYINNELSDKIPSKDEATFYKAICDDKNVSVSWDNESWGLLLKNLTKKAKCNLYFYQGDTVFNFDYTGSEQTFTAPVSGIYKLETWGAQGGSYSNEYYGGYGGYSKGEINLLEKQTVNIVVGGSGESESSKLSQGGYNGGGNGDYQRGFEDKRFFGSGGGATHVSTKIGLLSELTNYKNSILIVSGGGGGSFYDGPNSTSACGGAGGGFKGKEGFVTNNGWGTAGYGGTQNNAGYSICDENTCNATNNPLEKKIYGEGSFGLGGTNAVSASSGGGSGFYGGGASVHVQSGGGGSSYIGNLLLTNKVMYCYNCEESNEESTKTISTTCSEETPTSYCAKKGNGYARITLVSIGE